MKQQKPSPGLLEAEKRCASEMLRTLEEKIAPEHTAVLVIDVQNDFCHEEGIQAQRGLATSYAQAMVPRLLKFLDEARKYHPLVVFVRTLLTEWSISPVWLEHQRKFPEHLRLLSVEGWGAEFYKVAPQAGECIVTKYRYCAFEGTDLELILRSRGIKTLVVTGVSTGVCVESTARRGYMKDFYIVMVKDCVAARTIEEHNAAISNIDKYFGMVAASEEIVSAWKSRGKS